METRRKIEGVYFKLKISTIGTAATLKNVRAKIFCEAKEIDDHRVEVRYLGYNGKPSGIVEVVEKKDFIREFIYHSAEPPQREDPQKRAIEKHLVVADDHLQKKEYFAAEYEYNNALRLDEENVRATFGKGLSLMMRGNDEKAREVFTTLSQIEGLFREENKHLFNEFGIRLRKLGMYDEAVSHYQKAVTICSDDEHLYFNLARTYFEKREIDHAMKWIQMALKTDPDFHEARDLLNRIKATHETDPENRGVERD